MDFPSSSCLCEAVARFGLLLTSRPFTPFPAPNLRGAPPAKQPACLLSSAAGYFAPPSDSPSSQTKYLLQSPILRCSGASAAPCQLRQGSAPASPWSASVLPGLWLLGSQRALVLPQRGDSWWRPVVTFFPVVTLLPQQPRQCHTGTAAALPTQSPPGCKEPPARSVPLGLGALS